MRRKLPSSFYNMTSMIGAALALVTLSLIAFLFVLESFAEQSHPYMGLITYLLLPPFLILGLLLIFVGVVRTRRRMTRGESRSLPTIDFNNPQHRNAFFYVAYGSLIFLTISAFGSYKAYEYTESVEFCGKVCHAVMKPEYTAYQSSPHARVSCAQCHIGAGATWYVKSKLSGAYQVYSTIFDKYSMPIETPIRNLRPAKETCEQCHWPKQFYSQKLRDRTYYLSDEANTAYQTKMLMKIGGGGSEQSSTEGIHAHMYIDHEISYVALDKERMVIPVVEARTKDGRVIVYRSTEIEATEAQIRKGERRVVDCIDCHNRPTHVFRHPARAVNLAMSVGWIDATIPEIKRVAVEALEKEYKTEDQALAQIKKDVEAYYKETYPDVFKAKYKALEAAIERIRTIYRQNYFPEMKVSWKGFPDNLDHIYSLGCFRCHDDKHVSDTGRVISKDCNSCHTILSQRGPGGLNEVSDKGLQFRHPMDIGDEWKTTLCRDCHNPPE